MTSFCSTTLLISSPLIFRSSSVSSTPSTSPSSSVLFFPSRRTENYVGKGRLIMRRPVAGARMGEEEKLTRRNPLDFLIIYTMSATRGDGKLSVICSLSKNLDGGFKRHLIENSNSLFRLLDIDKEADSLACFLDNVLSDQYNCQTQVFTFDDHVLSLTLEDVLYLTGLPIQGKPVIFSKSVDNDAFFRVRAF